MWLEEYFVPELVRKCDVSSHDGGCLPGLGRFRGHVTVFPNSNKQAGVFTTTCKQRASTSTPRVLNTNN